MEEIAHSTEGYSGADIANLCSEAAMQAIRELPKIMFTKELNPSDVSQNEFLSILSLRILFLQIRPMSVVDFHKSLKSAKPSVSQDDLQHYIDWNKLFGSN